jgi:soluble lytic murein transglycosylase-like protein
VNALVSLVITALISVESAGDANAIGDAGRAVGLLQIWPVTVAEANRLLGREVFTLADRANPSASVAMARVVLGHHARRGISDPLELAARWRNPYSECPAWYTRKIEGALLALERRVRP